MNGIALTVVGVGVGIACVNDVHSTIGCVSTILGIRGATFLTQKMLNTLNKDYGDIIDMIGWGLCAVAGVQIIKNAMIGMDEITAGINKFQDGFHKFQEWVDTATFWN